jgi:hypothetical protein
MPSDHRIISRRGSGVESTGRRSELALFDGKNADDTPASAMVLEADPSLDPCVDGVVFAEPGVQARSESAPSLPDNDSPAADEVTVMGLDPEPLRV